MQTPSKPFFYSRTRTLFFFFVCLFFANFCNQNEEETSLENLLLLGAYNQAQCSPEANLSRTGTNRTFFTSFESVNDFSNFYIVPQNYQGSASHDLSSEQVLSGAKSHKGWIYSAYNPSNPWINNNHRGYPTIQLHKTSGGSFVTPVLITFNVWLDMNLRKMSPENEWFSFATIADDASDSWNGPVLVNLSQEGFVHLMHVPSTGQKVTSFQTSSLPYPKSQWVQLKVFLDFQNPEGVVKVWQNGTLVSQAKVYCRKKTVSQLHFGLYAPPSVSTGSVFNDDLKIEEIDGSL
ncbi:heparin lyase I family protein [Leptospira sp. 201903070]|uniref:Heparin lyase I family protein n=1 Tax=Leptospira ainlahdjerensis TaxID=2810033 RepID=A0ABS2U7Y7_9LEPT|nr:heparin lyase I family protein [Leptospira ainlahdjerensis]MBM9576492.1 heparin lyase I family protein [Leptospira ainlahdjerensis]